MRWRIPVLFLVMATVLMLIPAATADEAETVPYPEALRISVVRETWTAEDGRTCEAALADTALDTVDQQLRLLQEELWAETLDHATAEHDIEIELSYRVSGDCWAGFLLTGRVLEITNDNDYEVRTTIFLDYRMLTFDMTTGESLTLGSVFPADSPAWEEIAALVRQSLLDYYPNEAKDADVLNSLCAYEALKDKPFLPSAGRLLITTPLWQLHQEHWQLVNTALPYPDFRQRMGEKAFTQTDNSHRPIVAITYDDGPMRVYTEQILNTLNAYGASATFFCIGRSVVMWPDIVRRELDYGHTVGSHTYKHKYEFQVTTDYLREDRLQCLQLHTELTGLAPELFRAPGGNCDKYISQEIGWPIILWCFSAGDTGNNNAYQLADRIVRNAKDGYIILMHDIKQKTAKGSEMFFDQLTEKGFMFATVEELLYLHGIVPEPDTAYRDALTPPTKEP